MHGDNQLTRRNIHINGRVTSHTNLPASNTNTVKRSPSVALLRTGSAAWLVGRVRTGSAAWLVGRVRAGSAAWLVGRERAFDRHLSRKALL
jgi:hypothetical protein